MVRAAARGQQRSTVPCLNMFDIAANGVTVLIMFMTATSSRVTARREDSDPRYITQAEDVKLRAFTTKVRHRH